MTNMSKLPIPMTDYNEIYVSFNLGNILDSYSRFVYENELNNDKLYSIFKDEELILVIENIIYNKSKITRENSFEKEDNNCYGDYYILTKDNFYRTDGISEVNLLTKVNKRLLKDISKFIEKNCKSTGFELYNALNKLSALN